MSHGEIVLVITQEFDSTADFVIKKLKEREISVIRFNTENFPQRSKIILTMEKRLLVIENEIIDLNRVISAWYRRPAKPLINSQIVSEEAKKFTKDESWELLLSLWHEMSCLWVSRPHAIRNASYKWQQLRFAQKLGFKIPKTLITNNSQEVVSFLKIVKRGIIKTIYSPLIEFEDFHKLIYTTPITELDEKQKDSIKLAPCFFQEYVPKKIELRITVVNNQVFACAIESQVSSKTKDDWRKYDFENTPHYAWELPTEVKNNCLKLVKSYGLMFGAIDMILTPNGEYVFLELNPNGQWVWIEKMANLPISDALVDLLANSKKQKAS